MDSDAPTVAAPPTPSKLDLSFLDPAQEQGEIGWLAQYRVLRVLGAGGMGIVFEAEDTALRRRVALKVLRPTLTDQSFRTRFLQEARLAASLHSDHIVTIYQVGQSKDVPYLAMEYLEGESLEDRLYRAKWLPVAEVLRITREVAEGLHEAHSRNLIHRDIKPGNIWLQSKDDGGRTQGDPGSQKASGPLPPSSFRVKLLDFGLAKQADSGLNLTLHGTVVGTPSYMAPEQIRGEVCDARTDLFSLGCVLYCMLAGQPPFESDHTRAILQATIEGAIPSIEGLTQRIPLAVMQLLQELLAKEPGKRVPSAKALVERVRRIEQGEPEPARRSGQAPASQDRQRVQFGLGVWFGAAVILLALLVGAGILIRNFASLVGNDAEVDANDANDSSAKTTPPRPTGEPIRVGILHSLTGVMARSETPVLEATRLAIEEINASGGVLGRPLEAVEEDGASDPEVFRQKAEKLITQHRVHALFGCWTSSSRMAVRGVVEKHQSLLFYPLQHAGLEESPNIVYLVRAAQPTGDSGTELCHWLSPLETPFPCGIRLHLPPCGQSDHSRRHRAAPRGIGAGRR